MGLWLAHSRDHDFGAVAHRKKRLPQLAAELWTEAQLEALDRAAGSALTAAMLAELGRRRKEEIDRGATLVGPHRDDLTLMLGDQPAKGYASHGESWSFALGLRLAAYHLLRHDLGDDPVLVLDDVFAELDSGRRERLAAMIADCEQVLITAAVPEDVPESMAGRRYSVTLGEVSGP